MGAVVFLVILAFLSDFANSASIVAQRNGPQARQKAPQRAQIRNQFLLQKNPPLNAVPAPSPVIYPAPFSTGVAPQVAPPTFFIPGSSNFAVPAPASAIPQALVQPAGPVPLVPRAFSFPGDPCSPVGRPSCIASSICSPLRGSCECPQGFARTRYFCLDSQPAYPVNVPAPAPAPALPVPPPAPLPNNAPAAFGPIPQWSLPPFDAQFQVPSNAFVAANVPVVPRYFQVAPLQPVPAPAPVAQPAFVGPLAAPFAAAPVAPAPVPVAPVPAAGPFAPVPFAPAPVAAPALPFGPIAPAPFAAASFAPAPVAPAPVAPVSLELSSYVPPPASLRWALIGLLPIKERPALEYPVPAAPFAQFVPAPAPVVPAGVREVIKPIPASAVPALIPFSFVQRPLAPLAPLSPLAPAPELLSPVPSVFGPASLAPAPAPAPVPVANLFPSPAPWNGFSFANGPFPAPYAPLEPVPPAPAAPVAPATPLSAPVNPFGTLTRFDNFPTPFIANPGPSYLIAQQPTSPLDGAPEDKKSATRTEFPAFGESSYVSQEASPVFDTVGNANPSEQFSFESGADGKKETKIR